MCIRDRLKSLADRLAEAAAEWLHRQVRTTLWSYAPDEALEVDALVKEQYRGIRPAPGYPACPEHSEKATLFGLLDAEARIGVRLTENFAMLPASAVSGFYFAHPRSQYFVVGRLSREQVADYASRKGVSMAQAERWLAGLLKDKAVNDPAADIARHFEYGGKIKRVHVTAEQLKALNAGELGVVQLDGRYLLFPMALVLEAEQVFAPAVALKVDPNAPPSDDPYSDPAYQVPDDLVW